MYVTPLSLPAVVFYPGRLLAMDERPVAVRIAHCMDPYMAYMAHIYGSAIYMARRATIEGPKREPIFCERCVVVFQDGEIAMCGEWWCIPPYRCSLAGEGYR